MFLNILFSSLRSTILFAYYYSHRPNAVYLPASVPTPALPERLTFKPAGRFWRIRITESSSRSSYSLHILY